MKRARVTGFAMFARREWRRMGGARSPSRALLAVSQLTLAHRPTVQTTAATCGERTPTCHLLSSYGLPLPTGAECPRSTAARGTPKPRRCVAALRTAASRQAALWPASYISYLAQEGKRRAVQKDRDARERSQAAADLLRREAEDVSSCGVMAARADRCFFLH